MAQLGVHLHPLGRYPQLVDQTLQHAKAIAQVSLVSREGVVGRPHGHMVKLGG